MRKVKPLTNAEGEVRELTAADFKRMRPASEVLSKEFLTNWAKGGHTTRLVSDAEYEASKRKRGERGKQVAPTKQMVSLRLSADVLEHFRATGPGWQTRIDEMLQREVLLQRAVRRKGTKPAKSGRRQAAG